MFKLALGYSPLALAFQAGTAESFSLMDFDERKNKFVTLKLTTNISYLRNIFEGNFFLRGRTKYQLSSGTKLLCKSALYLAWPGFLSSSITHGYAQLW